MKKDNSQQTPITRREGEKQRKKEIGKSLAVHSKNDIPEADPLWRKDKLEEEKLRQIKKMFDAVRSLNKEQLEEINKLAYKVLKIK
jgi:hypothetical protein